MTDAHAPDMLADLQAELAAQGRTIAQLQRARDAAVAANQAKSRYLVGVSHEIRSPLNAIYGYAQLLERDAGVSPVEAARVIRRSAEHLTNLVNGLLDISRIESGVLKLSRDLVPFPALLDQLVEMFRMQAEAKGLEFRFTTEGRIPACVRTDEKRLRQILINLLSNAVKYTDSGHAAIHVRYRSQTVDVEVSDSGIGIAAEDQDRIFEPFNRGAINDRHAQPGTGLGLAITRVLVQIMGGDITVRSTPGEGSTFRVRLLLPEPAEAPPETARRRRVAGYAGPRRSVLLVDDDPAQLAVLQALLVPLGFTVHTAGNGAEGIALAAMYRPDIALLDIHLPDMRGWQVAETLRVQGGEGLRILMVSANAHEFAAGGDGGSAHDGFLMKPVELEALLDALAAQLRLDWIAEASTGAGPEQAALAPPGSMVEAAPFLAELRHLGRIGHVRAIGPKLDELEHAVPAAAALSARLRAHADGFDLKGYLKILEGHGHGE
ncbi:ATP-binding protein [Croceibacterium sp. TMG7-5b_MA50]|uniref:ATP-binding response regulator n=1 Tax=Croceibacterium sp. TMG7-5b_MA50 TaxID=3121290 RepID=UPI0032219A52